MKMVKAYLTIDDAPSIDFEEKCDFLASRNIPAIFFCRGDLIEQRREELVKALRKGFIIGSHSYVHKRHSTLSEEEASAAIRRNDELLNEIYSESGVDRKWKLFRFPYLDNGCGSFPTSPDTLSEAEKKWLEKVMSDVVGSCVMPTPEQLAKKAVLQKLLQELGYQNLPDISIPAYQKGFGGRDVNITYCTDDWHLLARHQPTYHQTADDLKAKISRELLPAQEEPQIILAHDYGEKGVDEAFKSLVSFMQKQGVEFQPLR